MHSSNFSKYLTSSLATVSLLGLSLFFSSNSANAFSVTYSNDFESGGFSDWNTSGDTSVRGALTGTYNNEFKSYHAGSGNQAVMTTACPGTAYTPTNLTNPETECYDTNSINDPRDDDPITNNEPNNDIGRFNDSGKDQTDANSENSADNPEANEIINLQEFLGLDANALNIPKQEGDTTMGGNRTPKEGSAIRLNDTINSSVPLTISFDWSYLTNDGRDEFLGDSDYGFVVIYDESSTTSSREPIVLADSDNPNIPTLTNADDAYALMTSGSYTSSLLPAGNYHVGLGVVDIEGVNRSSALLIDNFAVREVPFEFSPGLGLLLMTGFWVSRTIINYDRVRYPWRQNKHH